jgi:foldase protein PrsA
MASQERPRPTKRKYRRPPSGAARPAGTHHDAPTGSPISRRQLFIIIGVILAVMLAVLAIPYYQNYIAPFNRTIITVDDQQINMRYFLERAKVSGADPMSMLQSLTNELVIKIMAPQYGIQVTETDIDQQLKIMASDGTGEISDIEFKEWYRQQLNESGVSNDQYRELVYLGLLSSRMQDYLAELVPDTAEQIHLHSITVPTYEEAQTVLDRLDAGEDFATVAREASSAPDAAETGGDMGWMPPAVSTYDTQLADLDIGEVCVIPYYSDTSSSSSTTEPDFYFIFMVSEKDSNRPLTEDHRAIIQARALELWLNNEIPNHQVSYNFNSEIYAWLNWQLQKASASQDTSNE